MSAWRWISILALFSSSAFAAEPILLKSSREIFASYATVMNLSDNDPGLREVYRTTSERLPRAGQPEELSNSVVMAMTELGGAFCAKAIAREKALPRGQRTLFNDVDFARGPSQFSSYSRNAFLKRMAMSFWQQDLSDSERDSLSATMQQAVKDETDSPEETLKQLQVLCTAFGSSLKFLVK